MWREGCDWEEVVSEKQAAELFSFPSDSASGLFVRRDGLLALTAAGRIYQWTTPKWSLVAGPSDVFPVGLVGFDSAYDPNEDRLVLWGGRLKTRWANSTYFFDWSTLKWTKVKKDSPAPKDFSFDKDLSPRHRRIVPFDVFYDSGLQRVVRIGYQESAMLEGDVWRSFNHSVMAVDPVWRTAVPEEC